jgi:hypothetical protein
MRRWLSRAAFGLVLIALPVWAQRGGGHSRGGGAHFSSHGGSAMHSSMHSSGSGAFRGGGIAHGGGVRIRNGYPYHNYRGYYGRRGYPYYGWGYYPWGWDGWYDNSLNYDSGDQDQDYAGFYQAPAPYQESGGLQRDLQTLNGKIDRLQADVEARNRPKSEEPATALVFRDQHVEEVHNYAIARGTLWVLNDHQAGKKIPLAQLDIPATIKMNDGRGVDFQVPQ